MADPFKQVLPDLGLAIERATERTPDDRTFFVFHNDNVVGQHRTIRGAQKQFREVRDQLGWKPPPVPELTPEEKVARDKEFAARAEYAEFWSHTTPRSAGRPGKIKR